PQAFGLGPLRRTAVRGVRGAAARRLRNYGHLTRPKAAGSWVSEKKPKKLSTASTDRAVCLGTALAVSPADDIENPGSGESGEGPMGAVMIRCPRTGRAVSAAIETEPAVFSRLPEVAGRMRC